MFNHAPGDYVCPFCLIVQGIENEHVSTLQSDIIHRNQSVTAFVGSGQWPNNHGNVLIVPNEHFENIFGLPVSFAEKIHVVAKAVAFAMKAVYGCHGISTRQHNEPAGNQDVWHYHVHVTPRYDGDEFYATRREFMPAPERASHAEKLRIQLARILGGDGQFFSGSYGD